MDAITAKNLLRTYYVDAKENEASKLKYDTLRTFCLDCNIFSFTELERLEYEVETRLNELAIQNAKLQNR